MTSHRADSWFLWVEDGAGDVIRKINDVERKRAAVRHATVTTETHGLNINARERGGWAHCPRE